MWNLIVLNPMINLLLVFYRLLGHQSILAIAALTLVVRLAITPLTIKQQQSAQRMQALQPEMAKLQQKYAKDKEKLAQEQMALYREAGVNPLGGCLPMLVQLPLMYGLWQSIMRVLAVSPMELLKLSQSVYTFIPGLTNLIPLQSRFLWLDLGQPDRYFVLPVLVLATSWFSQKMLTPPTTAGDQRSAAMSQQMQIMMPLLFGFMSINFASGLSIYFIISNLVTMLQYYMILPKKQPTQDEEGANLWERILSFPARAWKRLSPKG